MVPGTASRIPCWKPVVRMISGLGCSSWVAASAAFFTRLRITCTSWSRLPQTGGSEGS